MLIKRNPICTYHVNDSVGQSHYLLMSCTGGSSVSTLRSVHQSPPNQHKDFTQCGEVAVVAVCMSRWSPVKSLMGSLACRQQSVVYLAFNIKLGYMQCQHTSTNTHTHTPVWLITVEKDRGGRFLPFIPLFFWALVLFDQSCSLTVQITLLDHHLYELATLLAS